MTNLKKHLEKLEEITKKNLTEKITPYEIEIISLLIIYIAIEFKKNECKTLYSGKENIIDGITNQIASYLYNIKNTYNTIKTLLEKTKNERPALEETINYISQIDDLNGYLFIQSYIEKIEKDFFTGHNYYLTPNIVCRISCTLFSNTYATSILELNAHFGEISRSMPDKKTNEDTIFYNINSLPFYHLLNSLKYNLKSVENIKNIANEKNILIENFNFYSVTLPKFDLIFANPPFGINNDETNYKKISNEANFILTALRSIKEKGEIICIVPLGFLFRKDSDKHEYHLRTELTEKKMIRSIIELPESTFMPSSKIKTAILHIRNKEENDAVDFIQFNKKELRELEVLSEEDFINFFNKNPIKEKTINLPSFLSVSYESISKNDYDWQIQTYNDLITKKTRTIELIEEEIKTVEKELKEVRLKIHSILNKIRSYP